MIFLNRGGTKKRQQFEKEPDDGKDNHPSLF